MGDRTKGSEVVFFLVFVAADLAIPFFRRTVLERGITLSSGMTVSFSKCGSSRYCNIDGVTGSLGMNGAIAFFVIVCGFFFGNFSFFF